MYGTGTYLSIKDKNLNFLLWNQEPLFWFVIFCVVPNQVPTDPAKTGENDVNVALNNAFNYILENKVPIRSSLFNYKAAVQRGRGVP